MKLTRRQFIIGGAATAGVVSLPFLLPHLASSAYAAKPQSLDYQSAFKQLGRISFGSTLDECTSLMHQGLAAYLEAQLHPNDSEDAFCNKQIANATLHIEYKANERKLDDKKPAEMMGPSEYPAVNEDRSLSSLNKPIEELWKLSDNSFFIDGKERSRPTQEVRAATWLRAIYSKWQLREVMVEFWHNHFNVNAFSQPQISATFPLYDAMLRRHCFGNFRTMIEDVAQSPAMLFYLNNAKSHASPANENYARELFELHTLGADHYYNNLYNRWREVPGALQGKPIGYIDQDIYEAARAFTGWTIEDGANTGRGTILPKTGKFTYFDGWHDNYQKRVLATEFDPNTAPLADGRKVLDLVSAHPGTAMFLATKLCRRFIGDNPPAELIKRVATVWQQASSKPDQIAQVLRAIILSPEFAASTQQKNKRPVEFAVSFLRATGAQVMPNEALFNAISGAGYKQFEWPTPTGHPDISSYWLNTNSTLSSWNLLPSLFSSGFKVASFDLAQQTPDSIQSTGEIVNYWFQRLTGTNTSNNIHAALMRFMPHSEDPTFTPDKHHPDFKTPLQEMVMTIAMLPEFTIRG